MELLLCLGFAVGIAGVCGTIGQSVADIYKGIKDEEKNEINLDREWRIMNKIAKEASEELVLGDDVLYKGYKKGIIVDIKEDYLSVLLTRTNKVVNVPFIKEVI